MILIQYYLILYLVQVIVIQKSGNILDMERKVYDSGRLLIDEINVSLRKIFQLVFFFKNKNF